MHLEAIPAAPPHGNHDDLSVPRAPSAPVKPRKRNATHTGTRYIIIRTYVLAGKNIRLGSRRPGRVRSSSFIILLWSKAFAPIALEGALGVYYFFVGSYRRLSRKLFGFNKSDVLLLVFTFSNLNFFLALKALARFNGLFTRLG